MLFRDEFTIKLRCSKESALSVLNRLTSEKRSYSFFGWKGKPFCGEIKGVKFHIHNQSHDVRFPLIIDISVKEIDNGCRLIISTNKEPIVEGFFIVGMTFALLLSVASIGNSIITSTFKMGTVFPIIFSAIWTSIFILLHKIGFNETKKRFKRIFDMHIVRE